MGELFGLLSVVPWAVLMVFEIVRLFGEMKDEHFPRRLTTLILIAGIALYHWGNAWPTVLLWGLGFVCCLSACYVHARPYLDKPIGTDTA